MRESDFQAKFGRWLKHNFHFTFAYEIKITKGISIAFRYFEKQQLPSLSLAKHGRNGIRHKLSDESRAPKPFDGFKLFHIPAFVVLYYYQRGKNAFIVIEIDAFLKEIETCGRKSITEARAKEIGKTYELGRIYP